MGLKKHIEISIVFDISVLEISKFNCCISTLVDPPLQRHRPRHRPAHSAFMDRVDRTLQHQWAREKMDESLQNTVTWYNRWRGQLRVTKDVMSPIIAQADDKIFVQSPHVCWMMWNIILFVGEISHISVH